MRNIISKEYDAHNLTFNKSKKNIENSVLPIVNKIIKALEAEKKIIIFGNGGSASDSVHFAAELSGKFRKKTRKPLAAISISENLSTITAIGNDFQYSEIFSRQIEAIGKKGDVAIGITTSGNSVNVLKGLEMSKKKGLHTVSLIGNNKKEISNYSDLIFSVEDNDTARIQEVHIFFIHLICSMIDTKF